MLVIAKVGNGLLLLILLLMLVYLVCQFFLLEGLLKATRSSTDPTAAQHDELPVGLISRSITKQSQPSCPCFAAQSHPDFHEFTKHVLVVVVSDLNSDKGVEQLAAQSDVWSNAFSHRIFVAGARDLWLQNHSRFRDLMEGGATLVDGIEKGGRPRANWRTHFVEKKQVHKSDAWFEAQMRFLVGLAEAHEEAGPDIRWVYLCDDDTLVNPLRMLALIRQLEQSVNPRLERVRAGATPFNRNRFGFAGGAGTLISRANLDHVDWDKVLTSQQSGELSKIPSDWRVNKVFLHHCRNFTILDTCEPPEKIITTKAAPARFAMYQTSQDVNAFSTYWQRAYKNGTGDCYASLHHQKPPSFMRETVSKGPSFGEKDPCFEGQPCPC